MVQGKFLAEIVIIIVAIAFLLWWLTTNYSSLTAQFFSYLGKNLNINLK